MCDALSLKIFTQKRAPHFYAGDSVFIVSYLRPNIISAMSSMPIRLLIFMLDVIPAFSAILARRSRDAGCELKPLL